MSPAVHLCLICGIPAPSYALNVQHMKTHLRSFRCMECGSPFNHAKALLEHIEEEHGGPPDKKPAEVIDLVDSGSEDEIEIIEIEVVSNGSAQDVDLPTVDDGEDFHLHLSQESLVANREPMPPKPAVPASSPSDQTEVTPVDQVKGVTDVPDKALRRSKGAGAIVSLGKLVVLRGQVLEVVRKEIPMSTTSIARPSLTSSRCTSLSQKATIPQMDNANPCAQATPHSASKRSRFFISEKVLPADGLLDDLQPQPMPCSLVPTATPEATLSAKRARPAPASRKGTLLVATEKTPCDSPSADFQPVSANGKEPKTPVAANRARPSPASRKRVDATDIEAALAQAALSCAALPRASPESRCDPSLDQIPEIPHSFNALTSLTLLDGVSSLDPPSLQDLGATTCTQAKPHPTPKKRSKVPTPEKIVSASPPADPCQSEPKPPLGTAVKEKPQATNRANRARPGPASQKRANQTAVRKAPCDPLSAESQPSRVKNTTQGPLGASKTRPSPASKRRLEVGSASNRRPLLVKNKLSSALDPLQALKGSSRKTLKPSMWINNLVETYTTIFEDTRRCDICGADFKSNQRRLMEWHVQRHLNIQVNRTCRTCGLTVRGIRDLKEHMALHQFISCDKCKSFLSCKFALKRHIRENCPLRNYSPQTQVGLDEPKLVM